MYFGERHPLCGYHGQLNSHDYTTGVLPTADVVNVDQLGGGLSLSVYVPCKGLDM